MAELFHELFYRPLFNILFYLYQTVPGADMGIAIILTTIVVRIILFPLYRKSIQSQQEVAMVQPKMKELQKKYKDDRQKLSEELVKLYAEHKINPFSGLVILFAQMPILFAIYRVSLNIFNPENYPELYGFVSTPDFINEVSLGAIPIAESPWDTRSIAAIILAVLVGLAQFYQVKFMMSRTQPKKQEESSKKKKKSKNKKEEEEKAPDMAQAMGKQMTLILPVMITFFALTLPAAMSFYWITTTLFTMGQELAIGKKLREKPKAEPA